MKILKILIIGILLILILISNSYSTEDGIITFNSSEKVKLIVYLKNKTTGLGITGATCTIDVYNESDNLIIDDGIMSEIGSGLYRNVTSITTPGDYKVIFNCSKGSYTDTSTSMFRVVGEYRFNTIINNLTEGINIAAETICGNISKNFDIYFHAPESFVNETWAFTMELWRKDGTKLNDSNVNVTYGIYNLLTGKYDVNLSTPASFVTGYDYWYALIIGGFPDVGERVIFLNFTYNGKEYWYIEQFQVMKRTLDVYNYLVNTIKPELDDINANVSNLWSAENCEYNPDTYKCTILKNINQTVYSISENVSPISEIQDTVNNLWEAENCSYSGGTYKCNILLSINNTVNEIKSYQEEYFPIWNETFYYWNNTLFPNMNSKLDNIISDIISLNDTIKDIFNCNINNEVCSRLNNILNNVTDIQQRVQYMNETQIPNVQTSVNNIYSDTQWLRTNVATQDNISYINNTIERVMGNLTEFNETYFSYWNAVLFPDMNITIHHLWNKFKRTNASVVINESIISPILTNTEGIRINYTIRVPEKEGYTSDDWLPIKIKYYFINKSEVKCFSQNEYRSASPYCHPLVVEVVGQPTKNVTFEVELRPSLKSGNYTVWREILIDPPVRGTPVWINYGSQIIGEIIVLSSTEHNLPEAYIDNKNKVATLNTYTKIVFGNFEFKDMLIMGFISGIILIIIVSIYYHHRKKVMWYYY